jgi:putative hydrolase of the HAD superfamily
MERDIWSGDHVDRHLVDFLRGLRPRYKTALLSNAWSNSRRFHTESSRLISVVDEAILSCEVGLAKPDPRIYALVSATLAVRPEEAVFVDDVEENVQAARATGMVGILFTNRDQVITDVSSYLSL